MSPSPPPEPHVPTLPPELGPVIDGLLRRGEADSGPTFVLDPARAVRNYRFFERAFGAGNVFYAVKANHDRRLLCALADAGAGFEVGTVGELAAVVGLGVPGRRIAFSNPCHGARELEACAAARVASVVFEDAHGLRRLASSVPDADWLLRLNLNPAGRRFIDYGASHQEIEALVREAPEWARRIAGVTFYGCHATGLHIASAVLRELLPGAGIVNVGGGFLLPAVERALDGDGDERAALGWLLDCVVETCGGDRRVVAEPGGAIARTAGHAVARVRNVRRRPGEEGYHVDLGPTVGLTKPVRAVYLRAGVARPAGRSRIVGSSCARNELAAFDRRLGLAVGDPVVVPAVGHYSLDFVSPFQHLPAPRRIYVGDAGEAAAAEPGRARWERVVTTPTGHWQTPGRVAAAAPDERGES